MSQQGIRLNKYLAMCGVCSRRDADRIIDTGKVRINGQPATMGMRVVDGDVVEVNGKRIQGQSDKIVLAFYKPVGVVCTERDKYADKTILEYIKYPIRVTYAGRLDKESEGLIILTNDGDLIEHMMRGANHHEKEYIVKVNKEITDDFVNAMQSGIYLEELQKMTRECEVEKLGKYTFRIVLTQGMNRQIRRMCKTQGQEVVSLKRVRVMNITLDKLKVGEYRELTGDEKKQLYMLAGLGKE
ncbi:MAG: pseudouridine synthase [Lachnospiraceae bacterium]|nr:pseudouridine synthase [Lachnospiraceae bacterium]